jgi:preprotein translocase SecE subunit
VAKTRAQRKAERRAREARQARGGEPSGGDESRAQHATQVPESGDVAEVEAVLETGAAPEELGETVRPETDGEAEAELEAPAPSRADVGAPDAEPRETRRERRRREREEARVKQQRRAAREQKPEAKERRRGPVIGFLVSCWAELKRVQWPDRDTLVQASAITLVFIAVAAAYLGALDAIFSFLVKRIL